MIKSVIIIILTVVCWETATADTGNDDPSRAASQRSATGDAAGAKNGEAGQSSVPLKALPLGGRTRYPILTGDITVNFGTVFDRDGGVTGMKLGKLEQAVRTGSGDEGDTTSLGVAVEGMAITLVTQESDNLITRFNLGRDERFYFHRDSTYDPQAYMRAREMEKGAGSPQGATTLIGEISGR